MENRLQLDEILNQDFIKNETDYLFLEKII